MHSEHRRLLVADILLLDLAGHRVNYIAAYGDVN
jgi:hypothetical protein